VIKLETPVAASASAAVEPCLLLRGARTGGPSWEEVLLVAQGPASLKPSPIWPPGCCAPNSCKTVRPLLKMPNLERRRPLGGLAWWGRL